MQILCCSLHTSWIKTRPAQKLLVRVKFTGNPYSTYSYGTRIDVNGRHWNTCKLVYWNRYMSTRTRTCLCVNAPLSHVSSTEVGVYRVGIQPSRPCQLSLAIHLWLILNNSANAYSLHLQTIGAFLRLSCVIVPIERQKTENTSFTPWSIKRCHSI